MDRRRHVARTGKERAVRSAQAQAVSADVPAQIPARAVIDKCRRCDLWRRATQGVAGAGPPRADVMLIGEQPGDQEDRAGLPFVGPAGEMLDRLMEEAGLDRSACFVTNAVKHFKWEARGKRRLHRRPNVSEIEACFPWLEREIAALQPRVIILLGATAARSLLHRTAAIDSLRGRALVHASGARIFATYHPSALLRADAGAQRLRAALVHDLKRAVRARTLTAEP